VTGNKYRLALSVDDGVTWTPFRNYTTARHVLAYGVGTNGGGQLCIGDEITAIESSARIII